MKVPRPGAQISAREGYLSPKSAAAVKGAPDPAKPMDVLLSAPLQTRGLLMHVSAIPVPGATRDMTTMAVTVEVPGSTVANGRALELVVSAAGLEDAKVHASEKLEGRLTSLRESVPGWMRLVSRLELKPDRYQIRVVARQTDGSQQGVSSPKSTFRSSTRIYRIGGLSVGTPGRRGQRGKGPVAAGHRADSCPGGASLLNR